MVARAVAAVEPSAATGGIWRAAVAEPCLARMAADRSSCAAAAKLARSRIHRRDLARPPAEAHVPPPGSRLACGPLTESRASPSTREANRTVGATAWRGSRGRHSLVAGHPSLLGRWTADVRDTSASRGWCSMDHPCSCSRAQPSQAPRVRPLMAGAGDVPAGDARSRGYR